MRLADCSDSRTSRRNGGTIWREADAFVPLSRRPAGQVKASKYLAVPLVPSVPLRICMDCIGGAHSGRVKLRYLGPLWDPRPSAEKRAPAKSLT